MGLVVRVEGQGLARRFFVHWDDHPAKVIAVSISAMTFNNECPRNRRMRWHGAACCTMRKVFDQVLRLLLAIVLLFVLGMVLTLRKRQDKKRKVQSDCGSSSSEAGRGGDDMQSDEEVHVEGGTAWGGPIDLGERKGVDIECEPSDGMAEAAAAAASAASNQKYAVFMEPSPSCLPAWASASLEQHNITSFGALQEEIAGLSFKLIDWDECTRTSQEKILKNSAQLSVHDAASSKATLPDDRAFHVEAAAQKRADMECAIPSRHSFAHLSSTFSLFLSAGMLAALLLPACPCAHF